MNTQGKMLGFLSLCISFYCSVPTTALAQSSTPPDVATCMGTGRTIALELSKYCLNETQGAERAKFEQCARLTADQLTQRCRDLCPAGKTIIGWYVDGTANCGGAIANCMKTGRSDALELSKYCLNETPAAERSKYQTCARLTPSQLTQKCKDLCPAPQVIVGWYLDGTAECKSQACKDWVDSCKTKIQCNSQGQTLTANSPRLGAECVAAMRRSCGTGKTPNATGILPDGAEGACASAQSSAPSASKNISAAPSSSAQQCKFASIRPTPSSTVNFCTDCNHAVSKLDAGFMLKDYASASDNIDATAFQIRGGGAVYNMTGRQEPVGLFGTYQRLMSGEFFATNGEAVNASMVSSGGYNYVKVNNKFFLKGQSRRGEIVASTSGPTPGESLYVCTVAQQPDTKR